MTTSASPPACELRGKETATMVINRPFAPSWPLFQPAENRCAEGPLKNPEIRLKRKRSCRLRGQRPPVARCRWPLVGSRADHRGAFTSTEAPCDNGARGLLCAESSQCACSTVPRPVPAHPQLPRSARSSLTSRLPFRTLRLLAAYCVVPLERFRPAVTTFSFVWVQTFDY